MENTITISEAKNIINISNDLDICKHDLLENIQNKETNFEVDNYTFLTENEALDEVVNMYEGNEDLLGSFYASFIDDYILLDIDDIIALQEAEQYQVIGKLILNSGKISEMMEEYIRLDGYGHALNSYDGNYEELNINNVDYIVYRNN